MSDQESSSESTRKYVVLSIVFIILLFLNFYLIFITDTTIELRKIYSEDGVLTSKSTIPANQSLRSPLLDFSKRTYLVISTPSEGYCVVRSFTLNRTHRVFLNRENNTFRMISIGVDRITVDQVSGNLTYVYEIYVVEKPLLYLAPVVLLISIVSLGVGIYVFSELVIRKIAGG